MRRILGRLLLSVLTVLCIASITFFLMHSIPGGPFSRERALPPEVEANIARKYNLDLPVPQQFVRYMGDLMRGDLGTSFVHEGRTTNQIIAESFPRSAALGIVAFLMAIAMGVPLGIVAALARKSTWDGALMVAAILGVSVPSFVLASLLQYGLAFKLGWLPAAGWGDSWTQVILPALALAAFPAAFISRLVRSSMAEVLKQDYIRTARSKGVSRGVVILRHALRNALMPAVTYAGPLLAGLLTGSFVVENIFAIPGLGNFYVSSITDRDYTVIMGVTLFYSALLIGINALVDIIYGVLNPQIRHA